MSVISDDPSPFGSLADKRVTELVATCFSNRLAALAGM